MLQLYFLKSFQLGNDQTALADSCFNGILKQEHTHYIICIKNFTEMDTLGIEPRASRMLSGCDTITPRALKCSGAHDTHPSYACKIVSIGDGHALAMP